MLGQSYRDALGPEGSKGQYSSIDIVIVFFDDSAKIWATRPGGAVFDTSGEAPRNITQIYFAPDGAVFG